MQVLLAHPGTQHARRLAGELERRRLLGQFWTGLMFAHDSVLAGIFSRLQGIPRVGRLSNRVVHGVPKSRLRVLPVNELRAIARLRSARDPIPIIHRRNEAFQDAIPDASLLSSDATIGFDTSSWRLAARLRRMGRPLYLERTIGHPSAFARIEASLRPTYPDWFPEAAARPEYLVAAEAEEHDVAHRIVVASAFARDTLTAEGIPTDKIRINPYGVDWGKFSPAQDEGSHPMRFLFLGSHIARKGLPILLDSWRAIGSDRGDAELWLVGPCGDRERRLIPDLPGLHVIGPVPHAELGSVFAQCNALVLPSLFEGFSLTLLEALSAGLPVIATPNTGASDLLSDPERGRLVAAGDVDQLASAMRHLLVNPPSRDRVRAATASLRAALSWEAYGDRWASLLREAA